MPITIRQVKSRLDSIPIEVAVKEAERITQARPKLEYVPFFPSEFARRLEENNLGWWSFVPFHGYIILPRVRLPANTMFKVIALRKTINSMIIKEQELLHLGPDVLVSTDDPSHSKHSQGGGLITSDTRGLSLVMSDIQLAVRIPCVLMRP